MSAGVVRNFALRAVLSIFAPCSIILEPCSFKANRKEFRQLRNLRDFEVPTLGYLDTLLEKR